MAQSCPILCDPMDCSMPGFLKNINTVYIAYNGLPWWLSDKEPACQCRRCRFNSRVRKFPWRRKWQPTPLFLPGAFRGQRSLVGYSPRDHKELDTTEHLCTCTRAHTHTIINKKKKSATLKKVQLTVNFYFIKEFNSMVKTKSLADYSPWGHKRVRHD